MPTTLIAVRYENVVSLKTMVKPGKTSAVRDSEG